MSLDKNIEVAVGTDALPVEDTQFTIPLHATDDVTFSERVREYRSSKDGTDDDELGTDALAAIAQHFSQELHTPSILIGRADDTAVAQVVTGTVGGTPVEGDVVSMTINGIKGEYTALTTPTPASVAAGLRAALTTALADEDVTVGGADADVTVTADNAGESFTYSGSYTQTGASTGTLTIVLTTANTGIETDLEAIAAENNTWFGLTLGIDATAATHKVRIKGCAKYAEANDKLFMPQTSEADVLTKTAGNIGEWLKDKGYNNTAPVWHDDDSELLAVGVMAYKFQADPDLKTTMWAYCPVVGAGDPALTTTQESNLDSYNMNYASAFGGNPKFWGGTVASGRKIDLIITLLWYAARLKEGYIQLLSDVSARNDKIGISDKELKALPNKANETNGLGERVRHFAEGSTEASVPLVADIPVGYKAERKIPVTSSGIALGAVEKITVTAYVALP